METVSETHEKAAPLPQTHSEDGVKEQRELKSPEDFYKESVKRKDVRRILEELAK